MVLKALDGGLNVGKLGGDSFVRAAGVHDFLDFRELDLQLAQLAGELSEFLFPLLNELGHVGDAHFPAYLAKELPAGSALGVLRVQLFHQVHAFTDQLLELVGVQAARHYLHAAFPRVFVLPEDLQVDADGLPDLVHGKDGVLHILQVFLLLPDEALLEGVVRVRASLHLCEHQLKERVQVRDLVQALAQSLQILVHLAQGLVKVLV